MENKSKLCPLCKKSWDRCECSLDKDFGVKLGSKEATAWKNTMQGSEEALAKNKRDNEILEIVIAHSKKRMEEETEAFK